METEQDIEQKERSSLQPPPTAFVGREDILDTVKRHLLKGQHVCLYGDRGIGKTAIVEEVVRWLREEKPGLRFVHVADEMTFKNLLVSLARGLHELGIFRHPLETRHLDLYSGYVHDFKPEHAAIVTEKMIKETTLTGTPKELVKRVEKMKAAGVKQIAIHGGTRKEAKKVIGDFTKYVIAKL